MKLTTSTGSRVGRIGHGYSGREVRDLVDGSAVVIPAGTEHNIVNSSKTEPLKLYSTHPGASDGTVHKTKAGPWPTKRSATTKSTYCWN